MDDLQGFGWGSLAIGTDASGTNILSVGFGYVDGAGGTQQGIGVVRFSSDSGQTWSTLDAPSSVVYRAFAADPVTGSLYVGGYGGTDSIAWLVRRSGNGGKTWTTEELFQQSPGKTATCYGLKADAAGNLYAAGYAGDRTNTWIWTVRRRDHLTGTWTTVDAPSTSEGAIPRGITVHPTAGVLVVGNVYNDWTVRRSLDGVSSWSTVDAFAGASACAVAAGGSGAVYVAGYRGASWIVRRSADGGTTWSTLDDFTYDGAISSSANAVTIDNSGVIWVAGWVSPSSSASDRHWLVRKGIPSPNGSVSWTISDDFFEPGSGAYGIIADRFGSVFTSGYLYSSGAQGWILRKTGTTTGNLPSLVVQAASPGLIQVTWPASAAGFVLESTESLTAPNWSLVADAPVVVGDQKVVTLGATDAARFFRLKQQ